MLLVGPEPCGGRNGFLKVFRVGESLSAMSAIAVIFTEVLLIVIFSLDFRFHWLDFFFTVLRLFFGVLLVYSSIYEPSEPSVK